MWEEYFTNQKHLSLKELLVYHISLLNADESTASVKNTANNLIQISTNSKLSLLNLDKTQLNESLSHPLKCAANVDFCILKSFDTMQQFSTKIKTFLTQEPLNSKHFLFIQSDLNQEYGADIIACTRHTIVENFKDIFIGEPSQHFYIILLINIAKENVDKFIGYQFGHWSCYHCDELEENSHDLPAFENLRNKSLSELLTDSLNQNGDTSALDLRILLKKLSHNACSLIKDTHLSRTISRIELFIRLCDNPEFVHVLGKRLCGLQEAKESSGFMPKSREWLCKEAANVKTIIEFASLRRACQHYFESRLSPLLGYLLSFVDQYANLQTLYTSMSETDSSWKSHLWLNILDNQDICKLEYSAMRCPVTSAELNQFECKSDIAAAVGYDESQVSSPCLPFFWLIIDQLSHLHSNFVGSIQDSLIHQTNYSHTIWQLFKETTLFNLFNRTITKQMAHAEEDRDCYINDFLIKCAKISNITDLAVVGSIFKSLLDCLTANETRRSDLKLCLPMVHYLFDKNKKEIELYLKLTSFEPRLDGKNLLKQ